MSEVDKKKLIDIGKQVRAWAIENRLSYENVDSDLCGMCAITSSRLSKELKEKNIEFEIWESESNIGNHVFVVSNGFIIDVTATQYRMDDVVVERIEDMKEYVIYKKKRKYKDHMHLINEQQKTGWPEFQIIKKEHI